MKGLSFAMRSSLQHIPLAAFGRKSFCLRIRLTTSDLLFSKFHRWGYSTRRKPSPRAQKMEQESLSAKKDPFYVVRKGDLVGVYKTFKDCQEQLSSFVCDPAVSIFKGHSLQKETENYLSAKGLKNSVYAISSSDVRDDLFGALLPCSIQDVNEPEPVLDFSVKNAEVAEFIEKDSQHCDNISCIIEFDGASKGNPGRAGAGAVIRSEDGTVIYRAREGLGVATNNVAEYRAMILGMKCALNKGFRKIRVQGDSKLVCNQLNGVWRTRHKNLINLNREANDLKEKFLSFELRHVKREFNSSADAEANHAINLPNGEVHLES